MRDMYMQTQGNSGARGSKKEELNSMYTGDVMNQGGIMSEENGCGML